MSLEGISKGGKSSLSLLVLNRNYSILIPDLNQNSNKRNSSILAWSNKWRDIASRHTIQ